MDKKMRNPVAVRIVIFLLCALFLCGCSTDAASQQTQPELPSQTTQAEKPVQTGQENTPETQAPDTEKEPEPSDEPVQVLPDYDSFGIATAELVKDHAVKNWTAAAAAEDEFYSGRLIVRASAPIDFAQFQPTACVAGPDYLYLVQFATSKDAESAFRTLANMSDVIYVEPDGYLGTEDDRSSASEAQSWGVSAIGADKLAAYVGSVTTEQITVAVVDSGVSRHAFLGDRILSGGYDFVDNDSDPSDLESHGTHVAGTIVDCTPGLNVRILPVRVLNENRHGLCSTVGAGIRYAADHGAKVINLSLGGDHSNYIEDAVEYATRKGICVVVAAGNDYRSIGDTCPAHIKEVLTVGAVDSHLQKADFSNTGTPLDLVCPGVGIISCVPGGGYRSKDGTSMAAPHATACVAMLRLLYPSASPSELERMLCSHTTDLGDPGLDAYYGAGLPDLTQFVPAVEVLPTDIRLNTDSLWMQAGDSVDLVATVSPSDASDQTVTWSSSNPLVAYVSDTGTVWADMAGEAEIMARTVNGLTAVCYVTVEAAPAGSITLSTYNESKTMNCWDSYWNSTLAVPLWMLPLPAVSTSPEGGSVSWSIISGQAYMADDYIAAQQPGTIVARAEYSYLGNMYTADYTVTLRIYKTTTDVNYLQSAPTLHSEILDYVPSGATVDITEVAWDPAVQASDGIYYLYGKTIYNGIEGWIVIS